MKLKLAISSCPNDTFMFDHFLKHTDLDIELLIEDIESLNKMAMTEESDITKLSYHTFAKLTESYNLLNAGGALGENCGPILISKHKAYPDEISDMKIAIPGEMTTANLLLDIFYPKVKEKQIYVFSDIEDAVLDGECDAGLIIHESRFTYEQKGLKKIIDIGELWENHYHLPTPLGGIAIHKRIPEAIASKIDIALKNSILHAFKQPEEAMPFIRKHAQEMEDEVMKKHITLYVNNYSVGDDPAVSKSIKKLLDLHQQNITK
ncbi:MAG: 1,4-dihydroxy-6-naphthoate synthase [Bacteroidota bacterium]|nr:1,4-dihydroxy-6-naphthoate synthase [Bacteroidota bacterium]